jgi:acetoin utilization deacetylase AcuC-like enzyme
MTTALITHKACLGHTPPAGHPERPERLEAVLKALEAPEFSPLARHEAPLAEKAAIARAHDPDYVDEVLSSIPKTGYVQFDSDTFGSPGSGEAALRAAGSAVLAVDLVMKGEAKNAFCAVRPCGHHALPSRAMGFCLFNNVAVGAWRARDAHGIKRVAVVDFDVHHGNGTQDMFYSDAELYYASTHQSPLYPGTGQRNETGVADNIVNAPLRPGASGAEFRAAFEASILPTLRQFRPELVIISAGFDAHKNDPLAQLRLDESDYFWATEQLCAIAGDHCGGRVVSALEGGYDLEALAASSAAHVRALMAA